MRDHTDVLDGINYHHWVDDFVKLPDPNENVGYLSREDIRVMKTDKKVFSKTRTTSY